LQMKRIAGLVSEPVAVGQSSRAEICNYVADMALELRSMCKHNDLGYLSYLMEIVFIEATEQSTRINSARQPSTDE
jgi:hypothetical protein